MEEKTGDRPLRFTPVSYTPDSFLEYPISRPFIDSDYTRVTGPVNAYPTHDRNAVISALRNLQEKIKNLELERNLAEQNLQSISLETEQYKELQNIEKCWNHRHKQRTESGETVFKNVKELEGQLSLAENRCQLLEKQLEKLRRMVQNSEQSKRELMDQIQKMQQMRDLSGADMKLHLERLNELESDQRRLMLTQRLAESKIKDLEKKMIEEERCGEMLQQRTAQVWSSKKPVNKKKKMSPVRLSSCRREPAKHYRLNLADIPFVAGQSTEPSHSLGANIQEVLAMLKLHNTALCSQVIKDRDSQGSLDSSSSVSGIAEVDQDLGDVLIQLQDELGVLSSKHQEILDQIRSSRDVKIKEKLQQELDVLQENIENKSRQISKIRQHQRKDEEFQKAKPALDIRTGSKRMCSGSNHEEKRKASGSNRNEKSRSHSGCKSRDSTQFRKPSFVMLRDMKKLQCRLQKSDLFWE